MMSDNDGYCCFCVAAERWVGVGDVGMVVVLVLLLPLLWLMYVAVVVVVTAVCVRFVLCCLVEFVV